MSNTIKKIKTSSGDLPIDYTALANKPYWNVNSSIVNIIGSSPIELKVGTPVTYDLSTYLTEDANMYLALFTITYVSTTENKVANLSVFGAGGHSANGRILQSVTSGNNGTNIHFFPMLIGANKQITLEPSNTNGKASFFRMYAWTVV